jgi:hypothetical protein
MNVDELIGLRFELVTEWVMKGDRIALRALDWREHGGWLYAFVVDGEVKYIGLTNRVLRSRMDNYRDKIPAATAVRVGSTRNRLASSDCDMHGAASTLTGSSRVT